MSYVLITGGAKRLGAAVCKELAEQKYNLLIHYNTSEHEAGKLLKEVRNCGIKAEKVQGDFSSEKSVLKFVERVKHYPIKHLINNVGNYFVGSFLQTDNKTWEEIFHNNLHAPSILIRALASIIIKEKGSIINLGVAGLNAGRADTYHSAYFTAKMALLTLTRCLAKEMAPFGVRVNMVSPGQLTISVDRPDNESLPMKRLCEPVEAAVLISFLLDEKNKSITGQNIEIAGGVRL